MKAVTGSAAGFAVGVAALIACGFAHERVSRPMCCEAIN